MLYSVDCVLHPKTYPVACTRAYTRTTEIGFSYRRIGLRHLRLSLGKM